MSSFLSLQDQGGFFTLSREGFPFSSIPSELPEVTDLDIHQHKSLVGFLPLPYRSEGGKIKIGTSETKADEWMGYPWFDKLPLQWERVHSQELFRKGGVASILFRRNQTRVGFMGRPVHANGAVLPEYVLFPSEDVLPRRMPQRKTRHGGQPIEIFADLPEQRRQIAKLLGVGVEVAGQFDGAHFVFSFYPLNAHEYARFGLDEWARRSKLWEDFLEEILPEHEVVHAKPEVFAALEQWCQRRREGWVRLREMVPGIELNEIDFLEFAHVSLLPVNGIKYRIYDPAVFPKMVQSPVFLTALKAQMPLGWKLLQVSACNDEVRAAVIGEQF